MQHCDFRLPGFVTKPGIRRTRYTTKALIMRTPNRKVIAMLKNIMVAFDGSELAQKALAIAEEIAELNGATLHVFHTNIVSASLNAQAASSPALQSMLNVAGDKVRDQAQELLKDSSCPYQIVVQNAPSPAKHINDYATRNDIDLIVMGSRGLGTMKQYFGSVAHSVLNVTHIPTLIVKE